MGVQIRVCEIVGEHICKDICVYWGGGGSNQIKGSEGVNPLTRPSPLKKSWLYGYYDCIGCEGI